MTSDHEQRAARRSIWRQRGRRFATGLNVLASMALAAVALLLANHLAYRYYFHADVSRRGYYRLSEKTVSLLGSLETEVRVTAFFQKRHELYSDVRNLLKEYEYQAGRMRPPMLELEFIDPERDFARARELAKAYDLSEPNVVVFESEGRKKYVVAADIVDFRVDYRELLSRGVAVRRRLAFRGEQAFSSAILTVTHDAKPTVYFLAGHGERDIDDFSQSVGFSSLARIMRRDNVEIKALLLAEHRHVPDDASALVVAGPNRQIPDAEVDLISDYMNKNGRVLFLLDKGVHTGLEELLRNWGVSLLQDVVVDPHQTLTGRELFCMAYGDHSVTKHMKGVATVLFLPRSVSPVDGVENATTSRADKPRVTVLANSSPEGWAERDLEQNPPRMDPEVDRPGPVPLAVAVERGPVSGIHVEIKPTRLVVIGDSDFVSNGAIRGGMGSNANFLMSAVNWILEREVLMAIAPKPAGELRLDMNQARIRLAFLVIVVGMPAVAALAGVLVWAARRK